MKYQLKQISFGISNNWEDHKDLQVKIPWKTADINNSPIIDEATVNSTNPFLDNSKRPLVYEATVNDQLWVIRLNNFPDYPCFTLMIAQDQIMHEIIHFDDWPTFWAPPLIYQSYQSVNDIQIIYKCTHGKVNIPLFVQW